MSNATRKRMFAWLLAVAMVLTSINLPSGVMVAQAAATSGNCGKNGDNVTWSYNASTTTVTISGRGEMADYDYNNQPWYSYKDSITTVVVEKGIKNIGKSAFSNCSNLTSVTLPEGLQIIGSKAFFYCQSLTSVNFPCSLTEIRRGAFCCCSVLSDIRSIENTKLETLGEQAFSSTAVSSVSLPTTIKGL